jgi:hypothetical protein
VRARIAFVSALLTLALPAFAAPSQFSVTFPERGDYSFWMCSAAGDVTTTPITARDHTDVAVPAEAHAGDVLYVLDLATGRLAATPLSVDNFGHVAAVNLLQSDVTLLPRGDGADEPVLLGHTTSTRSGNSKANLATVTTGYANAPAQDYWADLVLAFLLGAALAGIAGWFAVRLARRNAIMNLMPDAVAVRAPGQSFSTVEIDEPTAPTVRVTRFGDRPGRHRKKRGVPHLIGIQGVVAGSRFALSLPRITIGRDDENDIVVAENTMSRHHATLVRVDTGSYSVVDEESSNGIFVNGMRTQRAILQTGDEIKIGDCYFRFEMG